MKYLVYRRSLFCGIPAVQTYARKGEIWDIFAEACESQLDDVAVRVQIWTIDGKLVAEA